MKNTMRVLYLYNSGLLLTYDKEAVLIDGVFGEGNAFDKMPSEYKDALFKKKAPFNSIKMLLFTHCHNDHYDENTAVMFSDRYQDVEIVAPTNGRDNRIPSKYGKFIVGSFEIEYLKTRHIDVGPLTCDNYVYKITAGDRTVVITGDSEPDSIKEIISRFGCDADVFLINAAAFLQEMKDLDNTHLRVISNLYVYHLPSTLNDKYGYRKAILRKMNKAKLHFENIEYLLENMKYIIGDQL